MRIYHASCCRFFIGHLSAMCFKVEISRSSFFFSKRFAFLFRGIYIRKKNTMIFSAILLQNINIVQHESDFIHTQRA